MATKLKLCFELLSAATFGKGEGLAGLLDQEVEHDNYGMPYLRGRTLRGLLREEMEAILFHIEQAVLEHPSNNKLEKACQRLKNSSSRLLGESGKMIEETGILHIGDALLPMNLRKMIIYSTTQDQRITPETILESLTGIRRQTAMTAYGVPDDSSLRSMRVILRKTLFESVLTLDVEPQDLEDLDLALLTATTLAWRRVGTGRNRGRGRLKAWIEDQEWTYKYFEIFRSEVTGQ